MDVQSDGGAIPANEPPVRVIYIMGAARTGSTLLDVILGGHGQIESLGELSLLPSLGWKENGYCACGQRAADCSFWSRVRREWAARAGTGDVAAYDTLVRRIEYSKSRSFQAAGSLKAWPPFQAYARQTRALFQAIRAVSGKAAIVDSSKIFVRARALMLVGGIDVRIVHLVRDARGVVWSSKKPFTKDQRAGLIRDVAPRSCWRMSAGWLRANLGAELVRRRAGTGRSVRIQYEELIDHPRRALAEIGRVAGFDLDALGQTVAAGEPVPVGHVIAGNRLRMAGQIKLRRDVEWLSRLASGDRRLCWALTGWLMRRYGYEREPECPDLQLSAAEAEPRNRQVA